MALRPVLLSSEKAHSLALELSCASADIRMLEAELNIIVVLPFGSVLSCFIQCFPLQTKTGLIFKWNECKGKEENL